MPEQITQCSKIYLEYLNDCVRGELREALLHTLLEAAVLCADEKLSLKQALTEISKRTKAMTEEVDRVAAYVDMYEEGASTGELRIPIRLFLEARHG